ncbi:MAG: hypothetical protein ABIG43_01200 [Chloroflexota bacterium]
MDKLSYRMVNIGKRPAGLLGMDELFLRLYEDNCKPEDSYIADRVIHGIEQYNFIPQAALKDYREALKEEYSRYYQRRRGGEGFAEIEYGTWRGYPREQISWFPTVSADLCNACAKCLEFCTYDVYALAEDGKAIVVEPFFAGWVAVPV